MNQGARKEGKCTQCPISAACVTDGGGAHGVLEDFVVCKHCRRIFGPGNGYDRVEHSMGWYKRLCDMGQKVVDSRFHRYHSCEECEGEHKVIGNCKICGKDVTSGDLRRYEVRVLRQTAGSGEGGEGGGFYACRKHAGVKEDYLKDARIKGVRGGEKELEIVFYDAANGVQDL